MGTWLGPRSGAADGTTSGSWSSSRTSRWRETTGRPSRSRPSSRPATRCRSSRSGILTTAGSVTVTGCACTSTRPPERPRARSHSSTSTGTRCSRGLPWRSGTSSPMASARSRPVTRRTSTSCSPCRSSWLAAGSWWTSETSLPRSSRTGTDATREPCHGCCGCWSGAPGGSRTTPRPPRPDIKNGKRFLACWVGLMGPQDHVDLALAAVHHLVHTLGRDDCQFAFIGDGETLPQLRALAEHLGIADWVTFTGWLDESACFGYLATADLAMDSNLQPEVSPVKGMEYMAFGVPFVAFDLEETRAMADGAALYLPPGDTLTLARAIAELLDDPARRAEMSRIGRRRVEEHLAWDRQSETYLRVYERLLGPARAAAR